MFHLDEILMSILLINRPLALIYSNDNESTILEDQIVRMLQLKIIKI